MDWLEYAKIWKNSVIIGVFISFCYVFIRAYSHPCKCITLYFNNYNEANLELFFIITGIIAIIILTLKNLKNKPK